MQSHLDKKSVMSLEVICSWNAINDSGCSLLFQENLEGD